MTTYHCKLLAVAWCGLALLWPSIVAAQTGTAMPDVTAIDILLAPDQVMIDQARMVNDRLRTDYPGGFALDATHAPHITVLQRFVKTRDLDNVQAAVIKVINAENPLAEPLTAKGYYDIPIEKLGLAGIVIEPTPALLRLQEKLIAAVAPFTADRGTAEAFALRPDGKTIAQAQPTIDYVSAFVPKSSGNNFNPHVTIELGNRAFVDKLKAEPFTTFTFKARSVDICQLGEFGTAQKRLWTSAAVDPLPSWNEGPAKKSILAFVTRVTTPGTPDFVPEPERIATFDNDGTLWCEQPVPVQLAFALDRVRTLAPQHPEWKTQEPFASLLKGDLKVALAGGERAILELVMATHAGMTTVEFEQIVKDWLATAKHPKLHKPYTECVYQPMLEVLSCLRSHGFKTYIVSGGGIEFMRPWSERVYGIPPEQVVGSSIKTRFELRDGQPVLIRLPELNFIDDKGGKPVGINQHIGRRPVMAFGNSDGDKQMLEYTQGGPGGRFMLLVLHDDVAREFAYGPALGLPDVTLGAFTPALYAQSKQAGWTVVSMRADWKHVFPFQK